MIDFFELKNEKEFVLLMKKWSVLEELVNILGIPYRATVALQNRELTLSDVFGIWLTMELHLNKCKQNPSYVTTLSHHLLDSLFKRKDKIFENPLMACALYLDPRFRRQIMNNEEKVKQAKETLINLWHRIKNVQIEDNQNSNVTASGSNSTGFNGSDELDKYLGFTPQKTNSLTEIEFLIDHFDPGMISSKESIRKYWEHIKIENIQLYELAKVIYSIPPTEVQIERDFSKLDYVFNDRRCNLIQERLEDVMILNLNPQLFHEVKDEEIRDLLSQKE